MTEHNTAVQIPLCHQKWAMWKQKKKEKGLMMTWLKSSILVLIWIEVADAVNLRMSVWSSPNCKISQFLVWWISQPLVHCEGVNTLVIFTQAQASLFAGFPPADPWRWICLWNKATFYAFLVLTGYLPKKYLWIYTKTTPPRFPYFLFWIAKTNDKLCYCSR